MSAKKFIIEERRQKRRMGTQKYLDNKRTRGESKCISM